MFYKVLYKKEAKKFIKKNKLYGIKFMKAFDEISKDKNKIFEYDIKKYIHKDYDDIFRMIIGDYRAIFRIIDTEIVILVFDIDSRGEMYKK